MIDGVSDDKIGGVIGAEASMKFNAQLQSLSTSRNFVRRFLRRNGWGHCECDIIIVVGEVVQNILRHAFVTDQHRGQYEVSLVVDSAGLLITITDNAPPSNPQARSSVGRDSAHGGHGLRLIRGLASTAQFIPQIDGNCTILRFNPR